MVVIVVVLVLGTVGVAVEAAHQSVGQFERHHGELLAGQELDVAAEALPAGHDRHVEGRLDAAGLARHGGRHALDLQHATPRGRCRWTASAS